MQGRSSNIDNAACGADEAMDAWVVGCAFALGDVGMGAGSTVKSSAACR
jgi:hypothetical protein